MKKFMYFAAALLVLVGCNKNDNIVENAPEGTPFEKGQKVTLTIGTSTQQGPNRVAGVDNTTVGKIDFTWEEGDKILVKVGEATAEFTLISGEGTADGEFVGTMPAAGSTFDIQYPIEAPNLTAQEYTEDKAIPADKMAFAAEGCTLDNPATLLAQNAMLQLNLFGTDKTVGKIVFKDITTVDADPITLTLPEGGVEIGANSEEATPFYMVVPTGSYKFEVEVYDAAATPAKICSFATLEAKTFAAGECLNMSAKEVKAAPTYEYVDLGLSVNWATYNVGATKPEEYGDYFAWGETEPYYNTPLSNPISWKEGKGSGYYWDSYFDFDQWNFKKYNKYGKNTLEAEDDAATVNWGGNWRMPTTDECSELCQNCNWEWTTNYNNTGIAGYIVKSKAKGNTNSIFLPAAGSFAFGEEQPVEYAKELRSTGIVGCYWSSGPIGTNTVQFSDYISFYHIGSEYEIGVLFSWRCAGMSVRPVCPKGE